MSAAIDISRLGRGFGNSVLDSQAAFRVLMTALSRPGIIHDMPVVIEPPSGLAPATAVALLTLADFETPLFLPPGMTADAGDYLRFHAGCPIATDPARAAFAVTAGRDAADLLPRLPVGEDRYPDRSCTLFVEVPDFEGGRVMRLSGPGVNGSVDIAPGDLDAAFWDAVAANAQLYPLGVDIVLVASTRVMGLPRSTGVVRADPPLGKGLVPAERGQERARSLSKEEA